MTRTWVGTNLKFGGYSTVKELIPEVGHKPDPGRYATEAPALVAVESTEGITSGAKPSTVAFGLFANVSEDTQPSAHGSSYPEYRGRTNSISEGSVSAAVNVRCPLPPPFAPDFIGITGNVPQLGVRRDAINRISPVRHSVSPVAHNNTGGSMSGPILITILSSFLSDSLLSTIGRRRP